jgi:branched-chain amino acid transport system permease protein
MERPSGCFNTSYAQDMAIVRTKTQWLLLVALLAFVFFGVPNLLAGRWLTWVCLAGISIIAVHGINIITGYTGLVSLGHSALVGVGAYTSAVLTTQFGLPFWPAVAAAGLGAGLVGILIGLTSLRVKGFYLALITIAFQYVFTWAIGHGLANWTGGSTGYPPFRPDLPYTIPYPSIGGFVFDSQFRMYFIIMGFVVLMTFLAKNLMRTKTGRAFVAIRDNDVAAEAMGVNLLRYKLLAFFIGCFYAGIAGSLTAHLFLRLDARLFTVNESLWYLAMMIIGGMGTAVGPIFGVLFFKGLEEIVSLVATEMAWAFPNLSGELVASLMLIATGLIVVLFFIFEPRGLAHRWALFKAYYRLWPFSY